MTYALEEEALVEEALAEAVPLDWAWEVALAAAALLAGDEVAPPAPALVFEAEEVAEDPVAPDLQ